MDIIEMARELGKKIQAEDCYIRLNMTQKDVEDDDKLQEAIADFNMKRYELTKEVAKQDRDDKKVEELDKLVRGLYDSINDDPKMIAYNDAQDEFNDLFDYIVRILQCAANGDDPDTVEKQEAGGCGGDCSSCGGCG